jgi:hypothetical protein
LIGNGGELLFTDTGDVLQKGMVKFVLPRAPLDYWLYLDDIHARAIHLDHSTKKGVASINIGEMNSGEMARWFMEDCEG